MSCYHYCDSLYCLIGQHLWVQERIVAAQDQTSCPSMHLRESRSTDDTCLLCSAQPSLRESAHFYWKCNQLAQVTDLAFDDSPWESCLSIFHFLSKLAAYQFGYATVSECTAASFAGKSPFRDSSAPSLKWMSLRWLSHYQMLACVIWPALTSIELLGSSDLQLLGTLTLPAGVSYSQLMPVN